MRAASTGTTLKDLCLQLCACAPILYDMMASGRGEGMLSWERRHVPTVDDYYRHPMTESPKPLWR